MKQKRKEPEFRKFDPNKVKLVPITSVKLWGKNPRFNDGAVDKLAETIKVMGQRTPILVWKKNMTIYKGNTTYKAMKKLGQKEIGVIIDDFDNPEIAAAYGIADNKSSEWSEWDDDLLSELMQHEAIKENSSISLIEQDLLSKRNFIPQDSKDIDENLMKITKNECPKCGFKW